MKKYGKYLIITLILIAALVSVCFVPISARKLIPLIEEQVSTDLGAKVHIEKLVLRFGPHIKLKAPVMHVMYEDGQKFAQFDSVKFFIPWHSLIKKDPDVSSIVAKKLTVRLNSDDSLLPAIIEKANARGIEDTPNIHLNSYKISYNNKNTRNIYTLEGQNLLIKKIRNFKSFKINTTGTFSIGNIKYINYDLTLNPNLDLPENVLNIDFEKYFEQIKELDFHSDIIADLKLYQNSDSILQASGFVNLDNISVLDFAKKNPKSFAYLTLWGDKASVVSNIYASANQKIYVEGMINNSKKAVVDLKVKTDEIQLSDLYKKLRILSEFSFLKSIDALNGKLLANFSLKGDINKIKSNGYIKITNASISADGIKIDNINSDIDLSNNKININEAVGYVNKAPIKASGTVDKNIDVQLEMNKVDLKYLVPKSLGVQNGVINLMAKINGTLDEITHKETVQIDNLKLVNKNIDFAFDSLNFDSNKNNSVYVNNITCTTKETDLIKVPSLRINVDNNTLKIPNTNLFMPNSKLVFNAIAENINSKNFTFNSSAEGYINSKDLVRFKNTSMRYPLNIQISGNKLIKNINSQIQLENTSIFDEPTLVNFVAKLDKKSLKIEDLSLLSFSGKLQDDTKLNLKGQRKASLSGIIENINEPILKNVRLFIPQMLNLHLYDNNAQLKGDVFINGPLNKPDVVGQIFLNNLINQTLQLNVNNAVFDFNKNIIQFNSPSVKLADSAVSLNCNIETDITKQIKISNMNIKSKYINTDTLLMYKDLSLANTLPISISDSKFYSEKLLANVYGSPLYLYGFSSDFSLKDEILLLKNITSELFNGKLMGKLEYNLKDEHFKTDIMTRGVSAEPIFNVISTRKDNISGTMDFDANLKGELTSKQSLNGDVKFVVNNGRMSSLGKLEHLLYAQNVVADNMLRTSLSVVTKAITLKDTGLFKYLRGDVEISDGIANIRMLQSQGPLMALYMKGKFNPVDNNAKLIVLGRLSDEVVSGLGAFGDFSLNKLMVMLTGEETKTFILPEDFDKLPQLPMKNTKEFRSIINGNIDKPSSVLQFNWISYSQKNFKQKEVPLTNVEVPKFVENLPY